MSPGSSPRRPGLDPLPGLRTGALLAAVLILGSCAGDGSLLDETGEPLSAPEISIASPGVEISLLAETSQTIQVGLSNRGGLPLRLSGVSVSDGSFLQAEFSTTTLAGGESAVLSVQIEAVHHPRAERFGRVFDPINFVDRAA